MTFASFAPAEAFPYPKANNLDKIVAAVFAIDHGANTGDSVAQALDINQREGAYYADAAGFLGLVEVASREPKTYALTSKGYTLIENTDDPLVLTALIRQYVAESPAVQTYAEEGDEGLDELMGHADYSDGTAVRRAACIRSWYNQTQERVTLSSAVSASMATVKGRAADAAKAAEEARRIWMESQRPVTRKIGRAHV